MRGPWKRRNERWWLSHLTPECRAAVEALTPEQRERYYKALRSVMRREWKR